MIATMRSKNQAAKEKTGCAFCRQKRDKAKAFGVLLLMVTVAGCGIPGIITIPIMMYYALTSAIPCEKCRQAK